MSLKKLITQTGFSLVEVMIGGSILAGIGLGGAYILKSQRLEQKRIENLRDLHTYHQTLSDQLNHPRTCNRIFTIGPGFIYHGIASMQSPGRLLHCLDNCHAPGANYKTIQKNDGIDKKDIWRITDWSIPNIGVKVGGVHKIEMNVVYQLNPRLATLGYPTVLKKILFGVRYNNAGSATECVDIQQSSFNTLQNDLCNSGIGSDGSYNSGDVLQWDEESQRCMPITGGVKDCNGGGHLVRGIQSNGLAKCSAIEDKVHDSSVGNTSCGSGTNAQLSVDENGVVKVVCH